MLNAEKENNIVSSRRSFHFLQSSVCQCILCQKVNKFLSGSNKENSFCPQGFVTK